MNLFSPKPRFRFYNSFINYWITLKQLKYVFISSKEDKVKVLERTISDYFDIEHSICVPQARFGLYLLVKNIITADQNKIIMSPYTIHDVVNMVLCAGGEPIFVDVENKTCNINPSLVEPLIDNHIAGVLVTHMHGLSCELDKLSKLCDDNSIPLLQDSAQGFGCQYGGQPNAVYGKASVFSFGRVKNINAFYGGVITTSDKDLAKKISSDLSVFELESKANLTKRILHCIIGDILTLPIIFKLITFNIFRYMSYLGNKSVNKVVQTENNPEIKYVVPEHYKKRMRPVQAEYVLSQLSQVGINNSKRIQLAKLYHNELSIINEVELPPWREDSSHIYLQYPIQVNERENLVNYMMRKGRDVSIQHMNSASNMSIFSDIEGADNCPVSSYISDRVVLLPCYPRYGEIEVLKNIEAIKQYYLTK